MKRKAITDIVEIYYSSPTKQDQIISMLLGIFKLLYAIADEMGAIEDEEEDPE